VDEALAAFADRFLVRVFVDSIPDPRIEELLEGGWALGANTTGPSASAEDFDLLSSAAQAADLSRIRPELARAIRLLRRAGVTLTDRRAVKLQRLVAAAAVLAGRSEPTTADLWPLVTAVPTREEQAVARESLRDLLEASESRILASAAEEASSGPLARAGRIAAAARQILDAPPESENGAAERRRLRLEGVAREIDAGFDPQALPPELAAVRAVIVGELEGPG
jgi:MoxR-like ATPase